MWTAERGNACAAQRKECSRRVSGSRAGLTACPAPSEPYVQVSPHTAQASASAYEVDRGVRPGRHQRWTRTRVVSPVTESRRTTILVLPPCSRSGSKTAWQAAHRPPCAAILPVVAQARVEGAGFAPDLHEARHPGLVVARKPVSAVP